MSNPLEAMGISIREKPKFAQLLFYFLRECHINPLDEEYEITYKDEKIKIIKRGLSIPLFNALMEEMEEHYKREKAEMNKARNK